MWVGRDSNPLTARPIRQFVFRLDLQSSAVTYPIHPFITPSRSGSRTLHLRYLKSSQGEPHIRLALCCSISWNRTKFLWTSLQRVLCLRRPSFWQKESICNSTQSWMWFPLLFVSNTLICWQVSVYASPPELVKQVYISMTISPVLWTRRESNPPRSPCKGVPPALEHASPKYSSNL